MAIGYNIDIDPNSSDFSKAFKDFYSVHFINSFGLTRGDVDTSFFASMTNSEKEIAKRLIRQNLKLRQAHLFTASGQLKDKEALTILYEQLENNDDLSWQMTIGQAIWRINGDSLYPKLLTQLKNYPSELMRQAHFEQVLDLQNEQSIEAYFDYLNDSNSIITSMTLSKLNYWLTGKYSDTFLFDKNYFIENRNNKDLKETLLQKLKTLG